MGLFLATEDDGGRFDDANIVFAVQAVSTPNAAGTANVLTPSNVARGAVTALVTVVPTRDDHGWFDDSVVQSIALRGDGGSIQTEQWISGSITSTGPLGDLILESDQAMPNVTAPSIFGSILANGALTGIVQTTGQRTDPITSAVSSVPADLGRVYVDTTCRTPVLTSTVVQARGISGKLVSRGDLVSQVCVQGCGFTGVVAAQGNLGKMFTSSTGQKTRLGGSPRTAPSVGRWWSWATSSATSC